MKFKAAVLVLLFVLLLLDALTAQPASAVTRVVVTQSALCTLVSSTTTCHTSVLDAVTQAVAGDSIEIRPGFYSGVNVTVNKNLSSIYGLETAATILDGGGSNAAILTLETIVSTISIRNLTFSNALTGLVIRNSPSAQIKNNIFEVGTGGTAIQTVLSQTSTVANNTFYLNGTSIASDQTSLNIINNLFYQNSSATAITPVTMALLSIRNNLFFQGNIGPPVLTAKTMPISSDPINSDVNWHGNIFTLDPSFVNSAPSDIAQKDFHLMSTPTNSSPCQDTGDTSEGADSVDGTQADIGAYGGANSDTIPFPVSITNSSATSTTPATISLSWTANKAYTTKGYNIYYGYSQGARDGTDAIVSGGTTTVGPRVDAGNATSIALIVSRASVTPPAAPTLYEPHPLNGSLQLSWSRVTDATGYNIYYSLASDPTNTFPVISVSGGDTTGHTLSGLTNGEWYNISVKAVSQSTYYFAVTAYNKNSTAGTPGVSYESDYSAEKDVTVGSIKEGAPSNVVNGMPELIIPNPNLPNTGCFIATAAYGSPSAPAVQVLREFRDRRLLTNGPGKAFVRWYYAHSPAAAAFLYEHPLLKPAVRAALAPAVAAALFLTHASPAVQAAVLAALIALAIALFRRHRMMLSRSRAKETTR